jgi:hypothetical protein
MAKVQTGFKNTFFCLFDGCNCSRFRFERDPKTQGGVFPEAEEASLNVNHWQVDSRHDRQADREGRNFFGIILSIL